MLDFAKPAVFYLESVRLYLAKAGLCELLVELLEKHRPLVEDDETRNLLKMACDLIIIILNGGKYNDVKRDEEVDIILDIPNIRALINTSKQ